MKMISSVVAGAGLLAAVAATLVFARSGARRRPAFVTQNGPQLNLLNQSRSGVSRLAGLMRTGYPVLDREL